MGGCRLWLWAALVSGCGRATPSAEPAPTTHDLARFPTFARAITASEPLVAGSSGLRSKAASALDVTLPRTADGPVRLAVTPTHSIELVALDVAPAEARLDGHGVSYRKIAPSTDAFHLVERRRVEEIRVLHDDGAPRMLRWRIRRGPDIATLRVQNRWVEALDREGRARLRMEPPFVVDASGVRRELEPQLDDDVLVLSIDPGGLVHPIAVDPAWGSTDALAVPHALHDAVRLASGKVLVAGGEISPGVVTSTCELFDPTTRTFTFAAPMKSARYGHKLRPLTGDRWLAIGGGTDITNASIQSTTEIYDGAADAWTVAKSMPIARAHFGAVSLAAPTRVVVIGGVQTSGTPLTTATSYDAATDAWTDAVNTMSSGRFEALVARVGTSRILAAGGNDGGDRRADVFDPATNMFFAAAPMLADHIRGQCTTLTDGRVLVIGGAGFGGAAYGPTTTAEIYDRTTDTWTAAGTPGVRVDGRALLLPDGRVYAASGGALYASPSATVATSFFDPTTSTWTAGPNVLRGRNRSSLTMLTDGSILMAGGDLGAWFGGGGIPKNLTATVEVFGNELVVGTKCATNAACASALCVDGYCCDRACTGSCESCSIAGKEGTCSYVKGAPPGGRVACTGSGACAGTCDGLGPSCMFPTSECVSGTCSDGLASAQAFCDGAGKCATKAPTACAPFACGAVSCKTTCTVDADCTSDRVCEVATGACVAKKPRGATCTMATECTSGFCGDGRCCDRACNGACEACDVAASEGVCVPLDGVADRHGKCGAGPCVDSCKAGACSYRPASAACGATCTGATLSTAGTCSGIDATCVGAATRECPGNYACQDATACRTRCTLNGHCAIGFVCDILGSCIALSDAGADATADAIPPEDSRVIAEAGTSVPAIPKVEGATQHCAKDSECTTGHCVEGVCCDSACRDRCHSCALLSSPGKCTVEPIGVDLKSECGPARSCLGTCDGSGQCIGAGAGTMCARNRCLGPSSGVGPAYCAAPGAACNDDAVVAFECTPYACDGVFGACATHCTKSDDCARDFVCDVNSKTCVLPPPPESEGCALSPRPLQRSTGFGARGIMIAIVIAIGARRRRHGSRFRGP